MITAGWIQSIRTMRREEHDHKLEETRQTELSSAASHGKAKLSAMTTIPEKAPVTMSVEGGHKVAVANEAGNNERRHYGTFSRVIHII